MPDGWGSDYINASYINVRPTVVSEHNCQSGSLCHIHVSIHRANMEISTLHHKVHNTHCIYKVAIGKMLNAAGVMA